MLLLPTPSSYDYYKATGRLAMEPVMADFGKQSVPHVNLTSRFARTLGVRPFAEILTNNPQPGMGHFNAEGNGMVAQFVFEHLAQIDTQVGI